jgi:hypothetical protein
VGWGRLRVALVAAALIAACGGGDAAPPDASPDAFFTICGEPGDLGNSVGVGRFCTELGDCIETVDAPLCANFGDPAAHFCTNLCDDDADAGPPSCGEGASCACGEGGCGCTPDVCLDKEGP